MYEAEIAIYCQLRKIVYLVLYDNIFDAIIMFLEKGDKVWLEAFETEDKSKQKSLFLRFP